MSVRDTRVMGDPIEYNSPAMRILWTLERYARIPNG